MRIASLVPHATELLFALGLGEQVVAVTHECDFPPQTADLPKLTRDALPPGLNAAQIDAAVKERTLQGQAIYELDEQALAYAEPDLVVTQALCPVCAVSYQQVAEVAGGLPSRPRVISLDPRTFGETLGDIRTIAAATDSKDAGVDLVRSIANRVDRLRLAVRGRERPRVAALEWLDPLFVAGHWTPQLIELAGGEDVLGLPGEPSRQLPWEEVAAAEPQVVVVMPCGFNAPKAQLEAALHIERLASLRAKVVAAVNASAYFSRPGPRLVEGLELLAHILHPEAVPEAAGEAIELELPAARR